MAFQKLEVTLKIRLSWWLRIYLIGVSLTSHVTGTQPDMGKVGVWVRRGLRVTVEH